MVLINLNDVKKVFEISDDDLKRCLFPLNAFPDNSLNRLKRGDSELKESHIVRLAAFLQISPSELLDRTTWKMKSKEKIITFTRGARTVIFDTETFSATVFNDEGFSHELFLINRESLKLSEFLKLIS